MSLKRSTYEKSFLLAYIVPSHFGASEVLVSFELLIFLIQIYWRKDVAEKLNDVIPFNTFYYLKPVWTDGVYLTQLCSFYVSNKNPMFGENFTVQLYQQCEQAREMLIFLDSIFALP